MNFKTLPTEGTRTYRVDSAACFRTSSIRTVISDEEFQGMRVSQVSGHRRIVEIQVATLSLEEVREALAQLQNGRQLIQFLELVS